MRILITGGTGSLGGALVLRLLADSAVTRVVIFSRDEVKQAEMAARLGVDDRLRFFLGDVRDVHRLQEALWGIDTVVHAAALKRVDAIAYDPLEAVKTNVLGTVKVIAAAVAAGVGRVLVISSDKAVGPTNVYGTTKLAAEMLTIAQNAHTIPRGTRLSVLRYGNVLASRGSVVGIWRAQQAAGQPLTLTDPEATRFILTLFEAAGFVVEALERMQGGEIFVPILPSARVIDLLEAVTGVRWLSEAVVTTGLRPGGEKVHETLVSVEERARTLINAEAMVEGSTPLPLMTITPWLHPWIAKAPWEGTPLSEKGTPFASNTHAWRLSVDELRRKLEEIS